MRSIPINARSSKIDPALIGIGRYWWWEAPLKKSTSGSTWICLVVKIQCFGYAVLPPHFFTNVLPMPWFSFDQRLGELIGIHRQWSALRGFSDQCHDFDRQWSRESCITNEVYNFGKIRYCVLYPFKVGWRRGSGGDGTTWESLKYKIANFAKALDLIP